jgi:hypothetical protein
MQIGGSAMKNAILYTVSIPTMYWSFARKDKLLFKRYLHAYIRRNHPDLKVSEIVKGKVICIRRGTDEEREATYTPTKKRPGEGRVKSE